MLTITIISLLIAFVVGLFIGKHSKKSSGRPESPSAADTEQILSATKENAKITNADVQELLSVSAATAERYLEKLESQGHLAQQGKTGHSVTYRIP